MDLNKISEIMKSACAQGGEVIEGYFRKDIISNYKVDKHDVVTIADKNAQNKIVNVIKSQCTGLSVGFIGEEDLHTEGEYTFIIDPLDGTANFASGIPYFCVSIGLSINGEVKAGTIYDPLRKDMYWGIQSNGAFKNQKKLEMKVLKGDESMILASLSQGSMGEHAMGIKLMEEIMPYVRKYRILGALALDMAQICENSNVVFTSGSYLWDIAAAILLIEESGGEVLNLEGLPLEVDFHNIKKNYQLFAGKTELLHYIYSQFTIENIARQTKAEERG